MAVAVQSPKICPTKSNTAAGSNSTRYLPGSIRRGLAEWAAFSAALRASRTGSKSPADTALAFAQPLESAAVAVMEKVAPVSSCRTKTPLLFTRICEDRDVSKIPAATCPAVATHAIASRTASARTCGEYAAVASSQRITGVTGDGS